ncbi:HK97-gp10 family putative phage morphogenesis protein [Paracandidimonas soli]|uniref:HK97 gp10 family phage protein n=1 Tax=Paracandidimonas soli TaxID=1917182 RepID=A0A4R3UYB1_9BURK|nr:HK97-gp10 family putative phage morphogenesis protein [Paracandidimonas soli]TCU97316.1 HK97 gp10 family phage protein [Paracandidimonas soli]
MKIIMSVRGLDGVLETLQALPAEVVSKKGGPVKLALAKAARVIRAQAVANLTATISSTQDSESTGLLAKNVIVTRGKEPHGTKGERYLVRVRRKAYDGDKLGRRQKAGKRVTTHKTASLKEYGSSHQPATPWLRPAVQQKGQEAIDVFTADLNKRIDATVRKLAQQNKGK